MDGVRKCILSGDSLQELTDALTAENLNAGGVVAKLNRRPERWSFAQRAQRAVAPLTAGGLRQSVITLVQSALGGGVLTLAYAIRLSGLGFGLILLAVLGFVAFAGMQAMMRGAVKLQAFDTASLLAKCLGRWSGPAMDFLLVVYGNGALIAYFILLGDFLPAIATDMANLGWMQPTTLSKQDFRTRCILSTLLLVVPMSIPRKLSALRYASPIALIAIFFTAIMIVTKSGDLYQMHLGEPAFGQVKWMIVDWNFFKAFSVLLFAFNCHLNVVPVASELTTPSDERITKITSRVALVEVVFYGIIATFGYLSFLAASDQNILNNYGTSAAVTICRTLLSMTILVGISTTLLPTVRSLQGFIKGGWPCLRGDILASPLLGVDASSPELVVGPSPRREAVRLLLTACSLAVDVSTAIAVPDVADVMGFIGASVGTILMMVLPAVVLIKVQPDGSRTWNLLSAGFLILASLVALTAIVVMYLQGRGVLPK